jgi:peptide/nickel transport system substrate-binding protein
VKRTLYVLLSVVVLTSILLSACGPKVDSTAKANGIPDGSYIPFPTNGKSVIGAWSQEPDSIVPYCSQMSYAVWLTQLTLVGLAEWNDKNELVPELATEVPSLANGGVSADGLTITWHLKSGLKWSDGEKLTSADVKYTWQSIVDPGNTPGSRSGYNQIGSIDTPDDTTVVLNFTELYPPWQTLFTQGPNNQGAILPAHILEGKTGLEGDPFIHWPTVASGPFVITDWVPGDHMTFLPNPNFYKGRPILDRIQIKFVPDPETALAALQTGDIDWYPDFAESDIATVGALEPAVHMKVVPGSEFEHYLFNLGTTAGVNGTGSSDLNGPCPLMDKNVREAIIYGINRQAIVDNLLAGETTVPASLWPNSYWENTSLKAQPYDMNKAIQMLADAGYTDQDGDGIAEGTCNGQLTKLSFNFETTDKQIRVDIALAVQSDLKKIGVEFKPIHTPSGTFFAMYPDGGILPMGKYDLAGYTTGFYPDPYTDQFLCGSVPNASSPDGLNWYHVCDPELDTLFAAVNATADPAARKTAIDAVQKKLFEESYFIPMYARANVYGYTDRFVPGPFGFYSNMDWNAEVWDVK